MRPKQALITTAASIWVGLVVLVVLTRPGMAPMVVGLIVALVFAASLILAPRWAIFAFIAFPPGLLFLSTRTTGGLLWVQYFIIACTAVIVFINRRSIGDKRVAAGYGLMLAVMTLSLLLDMAPGARHPYVLFTDFVYYGALFLLVVNLAPKDVDERIGYVSHIQTAVLISILGTGVVAIVQVGVSFLTRLSLAAFPEDAGFLATRTHFGYLMAIGGAIALSRLVFGSGTRYVRIIVAVFAVLLVVMSLTRGAWAAIAIFAVLLAVLSRAWYLLAALPGLAGLYAIPGIRQRLTSDFSGGALIALETGAAGSHRLLLWSVLWVIASRSLVFGHGFGFLTTISPSLIFGEGQFVTEGNPFVYAHNDFLFLLLEVGIVGLVPYVFALTSWWRTMADRIRTAAASHDSRRLMVLTACVGAAIATLIAQTVDNGFFIIAVYERFIVLAACGMLVMGVDPRVSEIEHA